MQFDVKLSILTAVSMYTIEQHDWKHNHGCNNQKVDSIAINNFVKFFVKYKFDTKIYCLCLFEALYVIPNWRF